MIGHMCWLCSSSAIQIDELSGSLRFKEQYEKKKEEQAQAEEEMLRNFERKKNIGKERKQLREQKEESDKYHELQIELVCTLVVFCGHTKRTTPNYNLSPPVFFSSVCTFCGLCRPRTVSSTFCGNYFTSTKIVRRSWSN
jgi:hypothetical protein